MWCNRAWTWGIRDPHPDDPVPLPVKWEWWNLLWRIVRINHQCIYKALGPHSAVGQRNKPPPLMLLKLDEQLGICACVKMLKLE